MSTKPPLKFGIVGYGNIGKRHAAIIPNFGKLKAICDISSHEHIVPDVKFYHDIGEMLEQETTLDIVVICTPNGLHPIYSIKALKKKLHVICEKPMALNSPDALAMRNAAEENGVKLFIVKQNRFSHTIAILESLIKNNTLGEIFSIQINCFWNRNPSYYQNEWRGTKHLDGGILFTQFSHFIDLIVWLIGPPDNVTGFTRNYNHLNEIEFEDSGVCILTYAKGPLIGLNYSINAFEKNMEGSITVLGSKGTVKIGGEYLNKLEYLQLGDKKLQNEIRNSASKHINKVDDKLINHINFYQYAIEELNNGKDYRKNLEDSIQTVSTIERIYQSKELGDH